MSTFWYLPIMIYISFILYFMVLRIVLGKNEFYQREWLISILAIFIIIVECYLANTELILD